jgi:hypothetical protein
METSDVRKQNKRTICSVHSEQREHFNNVDVHKTVRVAAEACSAFSCVLNSNGSRDSSVGIAIGCGLDDLRVGVRVPVGSIIFSSPRCPNRL